MTVSQLPTTGEGTCAGVLRLPWPWPPETSLTLLDRQLTDGSLHVSTNKTGQLRVRLLSHDRLTDDDLLSCPLRTEIPAAVTFCIIWAPHTKLELYVNNILIGSVKSEAHLPNEYVVPPRERQHPRYDFSKEDSAARIQRRQTLAGSLGTPPRGGRLYGGKDYMFSRLADEIEQVRDLLDLVKKGRTQHVAGLAARLRLLIVTGKPLPLLQWCAASIDDPLIVFTAHNPRAKMLPVPPPHDFLRFDGSSKPVFLLENPVDLDVWLDLDVAQMDNVWLTN